MNIVPCAVACFSCIGLAVCLWAETLQPSDVNVAGAIDYGQTSGDVQYTGQPRYSALVFNGESGDHIDITVKGDRKAEVAIADGTLNILTTATAHLTFTLPNRGSDPEAYYILFREAGGQPAHFTVELQKTRSKSARSNERTTSHDQRRSD